MNSVLLFDTYGKLKLLMFHQTKKETKEQILVNILFSQTILVIVTVLFTTQASTNWKSSCGCYG